jgi:hypothetical protein
MMMCGENICDKKEAALTYPPSLLVLGTQKKAQKI